MSIRLPLETQFEPGSRTDGGAGLGVFGPVLTDSRSSGLTYESFYGLREKPFSLTSDSKFFYQSRAHAPAFDALLAGIRRRESLNVLTGDIGTGKTTLCRAVLRQLDRKTFSAFVPDPFASRQDLLKVLLMDFGVVSVDDVTSGRLKDATRTELSYLLYDFLDTLTPLQAFAVVFIDEAQNLSVPLLEEIRILSDSDGRERQLQVVLVGQLELREKLKLPEMRQVDQRVSVHCSLTPLGPDGVAGYVAHRLDIAGGSTDRIRFSPGAIELIYEVSGGVPRLINRICDRALHHGYLRRVGTIDRDIVEAAIPDAGIFAAAPAPAVAAVAAAGPAAAAPVQVTADPIDQWLNGMDEGPKGVGAAASYRGAPAPLRAADMTRPDRLIAPKAAADARDAAEVAKKPAAREQTTKPQVRVVPRTQMQKFQRRWARRLGIAAVCMIAAPATAFAGFSLWHLSTDMWELSAPLLLPSLPPERPLPLAPALAMPPLPETIPSDVPAPPPPSV